LQTHDVAVGSGWLAFANETPGKWSVARDTDIETVAAVAPPALSRRRRLRRSPPPPHIVVRDRYGRVMTLSAAKLSLASAESITAVVPADAVVTPAARRILAGAPPAAPETGGALYDLLAGVALLFASVATVGMCAFMGRTSNLPPSAPDWQWYYLPYVLTAGGGIALSFFFARASKIVAKRRGQTRTALATAAQVISFIVMLFLFASFGGSGDGGG